MVLIKSRYGIACPLCHSLSPLQIEEFTIITCTTPRDGMMCHCGGREDGERMEGGDRSGEERIGVGQGRKRGWREWRGRTGTSLYNRDTAVFRSHVQYKWPLWEAFFLTTNLKTAVLYVFCGS